MVDLLGRVRESTAWVVAHAEHVTISDSALEAVADLLAESCSPPKNAEGQPSFSPVTEWDRSVHFFDSSDLTVQYLLVLDALNFCFWPCEGLEYDALALGLKATLEGDPHAFDAHRLSAVTEATVEGWLGCPLPTMPQRVAALREVGQGLAAGFGGSAARLVREAGRSTRQLVALVTAHFPAFQDHAVYRGRQVALYKRAQIFVGDVWGAFNGEGLGAFDDIDQLTMFADYRVPQLLRHLGVLCYSAALADRVDRKVELAAGSAEEVEVRAATVQAVERLRAALRARHGVAALSAHIDWWLWQRGEAARHALGPHHRTLTLFY